MALEGESKFEANLPYEDGQWSPQNPTGEKKYSRDFLLALRNSPNCKKNLEHHIIRGIVPDFSTSKDFGQKGGQVDGISKGGKWNNMMRVSISVKDGKFSTSFKGGVELHQTENPWKPSRMRERIEQSAEEKKTEDLNKRVRSILNKLTPQKFDTLLNQFKILLIDPQVRHHCLVDLMFEKPVDELNLSVAYAAICKEIAQLHVPVSADKREFITFKKLIQSRCQQELQKIIGDMNIEKDERRLRIKSVGKIRFIGELFKQEILCTSTIMLYLNELLEKKDENELALECVSKLLSTVGSNLSKERYLRDIFNTIESIVENKYAKISSRVRFMLKDVIDLRENDWVPRHAEVNTKALDLYSDDPDSVQDNGNSKSQMRFINEKFRIKPPTGGMFGTWSRESDVQTTNNPSKRIIFSALETSNKDTDISKGSTYERGIGSRNCDTPTFRQVSRDKVSTPESAQTLPTNLSPEQLEIRAKNILSEFLENSCSMQQTVENIVNTFSASALEKFVVESFYHVLNETRIARKKTGILFAHLLKNQHMHIAIFCSALHDLFDIEIQLFVSDEDYNEDNPNLWQYYAEIITPPIFEEALPLQNLHKCCKVMENYAPKLIENVFAIIIKDNGTNLLTKIWSDSNLSLEDFMPINEVDNFVTKNELQFLIKKPDDATDEVEPSDLNYDEIYKKIMQFLQSKATCRYIFGWIEHNVGEDVSDKKFIRAFASAIIENSINASKVDLVKLRSYYPVFLRYIDSNPIFELQVLYAIQSIVNKLNHPEGLLLTLFNTFYEDIVISYDSFIAWESSTDRNELGKKDLAMKELDSFFTRIKENDSNLSFQDFIPSIETDDSVSENTMNLNPVPSRKEDMISGMNSGQWSPQNPTEEKKYSHDFLLAIRNSPKSKKQPEHHIIKSIVPDQLEFLKGSANDATVPKYNLSYTQIYGKIFIFLQTNASHEDIFKWIQHNVGEVVFDKKFIRVLASVLIENCISNRKLDVMKLRTYYAILSRYLDGNATFELQVLYAIQDIANKLNHPEGFLLKIFNALYEDTVISYDSYIAWESSTDPYELEKKGLAMKQLTSFFTQLKENDDESTTSSSE